MKEGEKYREQRGEIEPETIRLQAVGAHVMWWQRAFCIMSLRVTVTGKVKQLEVAQPKRKQSLNGAHKSVGVDAKPCDLPLARMKSLVNTGWRSELVNVEKFWMSWGGGERLIKLK